MFKEQKDNSNKSLELYRDATFITIPIHGWEINWSAKIRNKKPTKLGTVLKFNAKFI